MARLRKASTHIPPSQFCAKRFCSKIFDIQSKFSERTRFLSSSEKVAFFEMNSNAVDYYSLLISILTALLFGSQKRFEHNHNEYFVQTKDYFKSS